MNYTVMEAAYSGFCPGVKSAVNKVLKELETSSGKNKIYLLGKLIHNNDFLQSLQKKGIILIEDEILNKFLDSDDKNLIRENFEKLIEEDSVVIIRAHGIQKTAAEVLREMNIKVVDTTCPYVKKIHEIVEKNTSESELLIITGDENHPEVKGIKSFSKSKVIVSSSADYLKKCLSCAKKAVNIIILSQTTHNKSDFLKSRDFLLAPPQDTIFPQSENHNIKVFDTICSVTESRQRETEKLSENSDIMIVVGGADSSNTKKLYEISKKNCEHTYKTETSEQLPVYIIEELIRSKKGAVKVGIAAGASTPDSIIKEVKQIMADVQKTTSGENELSFEELLNQFSVTLNRGEKVKGIVSSVLANELHVEIIGMKQTGILPFNEITDDTSFSLEDNFKVGDEIEVQILKISDQDGTAALSKKRIDAGKNWVNIAKHHEENTTAEGKIISVVNGGLIALIDSIKVFVPASQANVAKSVDLQTLVGTKIKAKIIDVDESKHRAIASIRQAYQEERKILESHLWQNIAVGNKYTGTVKSIASYGAFVDIGGADGMVHRTELSWQRIKSPSDVVKIGDKISVYVKDIDMEKKRISLGYKDEKDNPWTKFINSRKVGDVAEVKIMSLTSFGAFAEIEPGVDGLIHISQISDKKIAKPSDELAVGQVCMAKITAIDEENQKVSLSIRELIEVKEAEENAEAIQALESMEAEKTE